MTTGPRDPAASRRQLRAGHADREQVIEALKTAFVDGRLTKNELAARTGRALAARTYANLAALTADIPAEPAATYRSRPNRAALPLTAEPAAAAPVPTGPTPAETAATLPGPRAACPVDPPPWPRRPLYRACAWSSRPPP